MNRTEGILNGNSFAVDTKNLITDGVTLYREPNIANLAQEGADAVKILNDLLGLADYMEKYEPSVALSGRFSLAAMAADIVDIQNRLNDDAAHNTAQNSHYHSFQNLTGIAGDICDAVGIAAFYVPAMEEFSLPLKVLGWGLGAVSSVTTPLIPARENKTEGAIAENIGNEISAISPQPNGHGSAVIGNNALESMGTLQQISLSVLDDLPNAVQLISGQTLNELLDPAQTLAIIASSGGLPANSQGISPFQYVASLLNGLQTTSPTGTETFTATATSNGIQLLGSDGDVIVSVTQGSQTTVTIDGKYTIVGTLASSGLGLSGLTWNEGAVQGAQSFTGNSDVVKATAANGSYTLTTNDGWGNVTTDYYSTPDFYTGVSTLYGDSYIHADGTSGNDFFNFTDSRGSTYWNLDGGATVAHVVDDADGVETNPDGSYSEYSEGTSYQINYTSLFQATGGPLAPISEVKQYDSNGNLVSDISASDSLAVNIVSPQGTLDSQELDYTTNFSDAEGSNFTTTWSNSSGGASLAGTMVGVTATAQLKQYSPSANGGAGFSFVSNISVTASGAVTIDNLDANGKETSRDFWNPDGTYGVTMYVNGNADTVYTYETNGTVVIDAYSAGGSNTGETIELAGEVPSPDGTSFAMNTTSYVINPYGGSQYTQTWSYLTYLDSFGVAVDFSFNAAGSLDTSYLVAGEGPINVHDYHGAPSLEFGPTNGGGTVVPNSLSSHTLVQTIGNTTYTSYFDNTGKVTSEDWASTDGTHGTTNNAADGSSEGDNYSADGSYFTFTDDGQGNIEHDIYNAAGVQTGDAWWAADGSHGVDQFNNDGTVVGTTWDSAGIQIGGYTEDAQGNQTDWKTSSDGSTETTMVFEDGAETDQIVHADGSKQTSIVNVFGNSTTTFFDANGVKTSDQWQQPDGSTGTDVFDASGNPTQTAGYTPDYDAYGNLARDSWFAADGSSGNDFYSYSGDGSVSKQSNTNYADGTTSQRTDDGKGDVTTTYFDVNGVKTNDTWTQADGSQGTDTFAADGSATGIRTALDGSHASYVKTVAGQTTTSKYDSTGTLTDLDVTDVSGTLVSATHYAADGSDAVTTRDNTGDTKTTQYAVGGAVVSDTWQDANGTSGNDVFHADGSTTATTKFLDGSYDVTTSGPQQLTTTIHYGSQGDAQWQSIANANGTTTRTALESQPGGGSSAYADFVKDGQYVKLASGGMDGSTGHAIDGNGQDDSNLPAGLGFTYDIIDAAGNKTFQVNANSPVSAYDVLGLGRRVNTLVAHTGLGVVTNIIARPMIDHTDYAAVTAYLSNGTVVDLSGSNHGLSQISAHSGSDTIGFDGYELTGVIGNDDLWVPPPVRSFAALSQAESDAAALAAAWVAANPALAPSSSSSSSPSPSAPTVTLLSVAEMISTIGESAIPSDETLTEVVGHVGDAGLPAVATSTGNDDDPTQVAYFVLTDYNTAPTGPSTSMSTHAPTTVETKNLSYTYALDDGGSETDVYQVTVNSNGVASTPTFVSACATAADGSSSTVDANGNLTQTFANGVSVSAPQYLGEPGSQWAMTGASGSSLLTVDGSAWIGDASTTQLNFGGATVQVSNSADPMAYWRSLPSASMPSSIPVPSGYDDVATITSGDKTVTLTFGSSDELLSETWTATDGSRGDTAFAADGSSTGTIDYADGNYSTTTGGADSSFKVDNYAVDGALTSDVWGDAGGAQGKDFFAADGSSSGSVTQTDGTYSLYTDDGHGDRVVSYFDAQGNPIAAPVQPTESITTSTATDGTVTTYDTLTQADGSYQQTWTKADGSHGTNTLDVATGEVTGSNDTAGAGYVDTWDNTSMGAGVVDAKANYVFDDSSTMSVDTVQQVDGSYVQQWSKSDGTSGSNVLVAATGETSGSSTDAQGNVNTWDTIDLADGATESKTGSTDASGNGTSYDTITQADGSFTQQWTGTDGSSGTNSLIASTGETTGSKDTPGAGYTVAWDTTLLANGATDTKSTYAYDDGSSTTVDAVAQADGASEQTWAKSDGSTGSNAYGAQTGSGDTFTWGSGLQFSELQTVDGNDKLSIGAGVAADQLWFRQDGNDLDITLLGTNDQLDVQGWYTGAGSQLQSITLSNGQTLLNADVQKLVDAMAAFAVPGAAQSQYTPAESAALQPLLTANWH